ncbi:hypothetical protein [Erinnyis ello granulovirus]|uniref:Uncharacterized protein n=1 Tax=Erinnyis ello granulovirus TaxID=307444 RepID=A0A097DAK8_9BBAC|nr:hypothetical protein [Erinnyis ello granulovirus]AIS92027.1 hypothetical protein [Erinnyis ello granulovirus]ARX71366.1 hypothetical protein EREL_027 [Erinnyis ello granulovirus]ARX71496.1 hypothetical protein EREL_027 [Erinnyis ello granulovirus]ARX71626.1 hypothetical protein EREL_027 [Erinnyis ello granulovirus]ARX71756.1 hypothetical protein EREL_027 [Erinnyis ello granulovirus]
MYVCTSIVNRIHTQYRNLLCAHIPNSIQTKHIVKFAHFTTSQVCYMVSTPATLCPNKLCATR